MMLRRILLLLPLVLVLVTAGSWYWLLHTNHGAHWVWSIATSALDEALGAERLSGDLSAGLTVHRLSFRNDSVDVSVSRTVVAIDVDLFARSITIEPASIFGATIVLKEREDSEQAASLQDILETLQLPLELVFPELDADNISVEGLIDSGPLHLASVALAGRWDDEIRADSFEVRSAHADASGSAQVMLADSYGFEADIAVTVHPELTGQPVPIEATAGLKSDFRSVSVDAEAYVAAIGTHAALRSEVDLESNELSGHLGWENFRWPMDAGTAQVESRSGTVTLAGSIDDWSVDGTLHLQVPQVPEGLFTVSAQGDRNSVAAKIINGDVLGGTLSGNAEYSWRTEQKFAANVVAKDVRTNALLPDWPATLSGSFDVSGQRLPLALSVNVTDVRGEIFGKRLTADGRLDYGDANLSFAELSVRHGKSSALLNGALYSASGLTYEVTVSDLSHFVEDAAGTITASGHVSLSRQHPVLRIDGFGETLRYKELTVTELTVTDHAAPGSNLDVEILAHGVAIDDESAEQVNLRLFVDPEEQLVSVDIVTPRLRSRLAIDGALDAWDEPSSWTGKIAEFEFLFDDYAAGLASPVELHVSRTRADLGRYRVIGNHDLTVSGTASWNAADGAAISAELGAVPLNLVNTLADTGLKFDQIVTGQVDLQMSSAGDLIGRGDIAMSSGMIIGDEGADTFFPTGEAILGFDLGSDGLHAGVIDLPLPGQGQIAAEFEVTDDGSDRPAFVSAIVDIDLADVGALAKLFPLVDDAAGDLRIDLEIDGPAGNPDVTGEFSLQGGSLSYLPFGLALADIDLVSELRNDGELELTGSFRAGDGLGRIHTRKDQVRDAAAGLTVTLTGDNLLLVDVPDVRAVANPDVQITLDGGALHINGTLDIPSARITPSNIGASKVYESGDVIIVAGELPREPEAEDDDGIQIFGNLKASLGNDVVIDVGIAETDVTGSVDLTWTGDPIPVADGRLTIDGEILAFGQRLEITEGQVRFPNVLVSEPHLRIRAEREIYGNTQVRRAGLLVAGSLVRPTIEPYTTPVTTEERAMTLLVMGSDFNYEQGVGTVGFGTYIAPKVYASYGIGLFDKENVIRLRYELKKGFGVTATSGQKDSGLDLSYRFEN